jgi:hypothetical protein
MSKQKYNNSGTEPGRENKMKKTIVTRVLTIATAAVMFAGTLTAGACAAPAIRVEAADASFTQTLLNAFDSQFYASKYADVKKAYGNDAEGWHHRRPPMGGRNTGIAHGYR